MEKQSEITIVPHAEGRYKVYVALPKLEGIRRTAKELSIEVDPEFGINVAATGDLAEEEIGIFTQALAMARMLKIGTLKV